MRHLNATWKLGRNTSHRRALLRNLVSSLILEERIETTVAKAKAMRPHVEKMITFGKRGDVAARRLAAAYLTSREAVDRLFGEIAPRYGDRNGGYLRIIRTGFRKGDGGEKAFIELIGSDRNTVIGNYLTSGSCPTAVTVNSTTHRVYMTDPCAGVSIVDGNPSSPTFWNARWRRQSA